MPPARRLLYLDWMRGLAILIMLQGHAYDGWMRDDLRGSFAYQFSQFLGGFPGPLFLFMTGMSLVLMLEGRRAQSSTPAELWRRVLRRSGYIFLMAILFRVQQWSFYWPNSQATDILRVDVLNVIAIALALSGSLMLLLPPRLRMHGAAAAAVVSAMATPLVWARAELWAHPHLVGYLKGSAEAATFPLFPWISYTFTGVFVGPAVLRPQGAGETVKRLAWTAVALLVAAKLFDSLPWTYYQPYNYWLTSPNLVASRTAAVLLALAACYAWTHRAGAAGSLLVAQLGRTSLLIYWVHIEMTYGRTFSFLQHRLGHFQTIAGVLLLVLAMLGLSLVRARWSRDRPSSTAPAEAPQDALANAR